MSITSQLKLEEKFNWQFYKNIKAIYFLKRTFQEEPWDLVVDSWLSQAHFRQITALLPHGGWLSISAGTKYKFGVCFWDADEQ